MVKDIHDSATVGPSVTEGILPVYRWALQSLYGGADGVYRQWARLGKGKKKMWQAISAGMLLFLTSISRRHLDKTLSDTKVVRACRNWRHMKSNSLIWDQY